MFVDARLLSTVFKSEAAGSNPTGSKKEEVCFPTRWKKGKIFCVWHVGARCHIEVVVEDDGSSTKRAGTIYERTTYGRGCMNVVVVVVAVAVAVAVGKCCCSNSNNNTQYFFKRFSTALKK